MNNIKALVMMNMMIMMRRGLEDDLQLENCFPCANTTPVYTQTTQVEKKGIEKVGIDTREIDIKEKNAIEDFFQKGCACKGQHPCYLQFPKEGVKCCLQHAALFF